MAPAKRGSSGRGRTPVAPGGRGREAAARQKASAARKAAAAKGGAPARGKPVKAKARAKASSGRSAPAGPAREASPYSSRSDAGPVARPARGRIAPGSPAAGAPRRSTDRGLGGEQVEGRQAVRELLIAGRRKVLEVWVLGDQDEAEVLDDIVELAQSVKVPVRQAGRSKFFAQARTESSQGVLARARPLPEADLDDLVKSRRNKPRPFLLAVDGVTDPGNLGALLRTAECAGVTGIVLPRHRAVHVTPTVTKAACGAVEYLDMAVVGGLPTAVTRAREAGVWVVGLDAAGTESIYDLALSDEPVMLVLGAEGQGLSRLVRARCDTVASLPLGGQLASLNVSVAGALACFEVVRRRRQVS
jgi:23S rRNA (guanosine2251-2'-O)-methyltransferase